MLWLLPEVREGLNDILLGLLVKAGPSWDLKTGYRMVERGADVDEVYNFAWFNFYSIGTIFQF